MNSHKSGQPKYKSFCDQQDNFNVERRLTVNSLYNIVTLGITLFNIRKKTENQRTK